MPSVNVHCAQDRTWCSMDPNDVFMEHIIDFLFINTLTQNLQNERSWEEFAKKVQKQGAHFIADQCSIQCLNRVFNDISRLQGKRMNSLDYAALPWYNMVIRVHRS